MRKQIPGYGLCEQQLECDALKALILLCTQSIIKKYFKNIFSDSGKRKNFAERKTNVQNRKNYFG